MAREPQWSRYTATPAAVGTPEAAAAGPGQRQGPSWTRSAQVGDPTVSWSTLTGQDLESPRNAFDTTFWKTAEKQDREQSSRGMRDRFTRPDATGVAVYDDEDQGIAFGDVYLDGVKQGNLLTGYAGLEQSQGEEMMARLVLQREVWAKAYESEAGRPLTMSRGLKAELDKVRKENSENYRKGASAFEFEQGVQERAKGFESSGAAQVANVAAGIGGGAAVGAGVGSVIPGVGTAIGAGVGAVIGGIGAWLNRDEQFTRAAMAMEQYELAQQQDLTGVGIGDAISGWVGVVGGNLSPVRNVTRGIYDAVGEGGAGDGRSRYSDEGAPLWFDAIDTAGLVVDGVGTWGSKLALKAYTATMGATASAGLYTVGAGVASGNMGFNPYSGQYEDLGVGGMALRTGSTMIDFAQTAVGRGMLKVVGRPGAMGEVQGGFRIGTDATGARATQRLAFSAMIPSEAATGISARMLARRSLRRSGQEMTPATLARETARHIDNLTSGRRGIATMAVNAFGEGAEELVQAGLDAASVGEVPTLEDLFSSAREGFGMGAGMGLAVHRGSVDRSSRWRAASNAIRMAHGEALLTDEQWAALSDSERAIEGAPKDANTAVTLALMTQEVQRLGRTLVTANVPELRRAHKAVMRMLERQFKNSQAAVEPAFMSTRSNFEWAPQDGVLSLTAAVRMVQTRAELLAQVAAGRPMRREDGELAAPSAEQMQYAQQVVRTDQALLQALRDAQAAIAEAAGSPSVVRAQIDAINERLRQWWEATETEGDEEAFGQRRTASFLAARYPLNSRGSFQLMRLQISAELELDGAHNVALMPEDIQPMMGGDYDGDEVNILLRQMLPAESYTALRHGAGQLASDRALMEAKDYVVAGAELLFDVLAEPPTSAAYAAGKTGMADIRRRLEEILHQSPMDRRDVARVLDTFMTRLANRDVERAFTNPKAREDGTEPGLFDVLPTRYAGPMQELAQTLDASPWLLLNRVVEDGLMQLATQVALTDYHQVSTWGSTDLPTVTSKEMPQYVGAADQASSEMLTAALELGNPDLFRVQTALKYNPYREAVEQFSDNIPAVLQSLTQRFVRLNDGKVRGGVEALFEGTLAQQRARQMLTRLAQEARQELGAATVNEALVYLAAGQTLDADLAAGQLRSQQTVNFAQLTLHEAVQGLRREYGELLATDTTLAQRMSSLDALTRPDYQEGTKTKANGGSAFVEVLGALRIPDLLGDAGAPLSYTVRQLRDKLVSLNSHARREFEQALRAHPQYGQERERAAGPRMTPYRVLVDMVIESARMELHETAEGLAGGARARAENQARANFTTLHDTLRELARQRGFELSTPAQVRAFLESDANLSARILELMEDAGLAAAIRTTDADGNILEVLFPQWIYEVFAEPATARAEMALLRNTLIMARADLVQGDQLEIDRISDRLLKLWLHLDHQASDPTNPRMVFDRLARAEFVRVLHEAASVNEFLATLNQDQRFRPEHSAPYMAWDRDEATVAHSRHGTGVSATLHGQSMREALQDAAAAAARELQIQESTEAYLKTNAPLLAAIADSRDGGPDPEPWERFKKTFELVRELPALMSMSVLIRMAEDINEIVGQMGDKGEGPLNVEAIGQAIARQLSTYDSALGRLFASSTSGSINSVMTDMVQLARGDRTFVMNDGTVVNWSSITAEQALDLLRSPKHAGLAARMLGLTAWDVDAETGLATLTSPLGEGVAAFSQDLETALFDNSQAAKFRRLMLTEGMATVAGGPPQLAVHLALQMQLRETAVDHPISPRSDERKRMAAQILMDQADGFLALSSLRDLWAPENPALMNHVTEAETGELIPKLNRVLRAAGRRARQESGSELAKMLPSREHPAFEIVELQLQRIAARFARRAVASGSSLEQQLAKKLSDDIRQLGEYGSPARILAEQFKHFDTAPVQRQLLGLLRAWGEIATVVPDARHAIERALNPSQEITARVTDWADGQMVTEDVQLPDLTRDEWHMIARAVIAFSMHIGYGPATSADVRIPLFPDLTKEDELEAQLPHWDPSGVDTVLDMFAPGVMHNPHAQPSPLLAAHLELHRDHGEALEQISEEKAAAAIYKLIEPLREVEATGQRRGVIGAWHALLPALMHSAVGAVHSSAAANAIAMAGKNPERLRFAGATTPIDWSRTPPDEELSTVTISAAELTSAVAQGVELDTEVDIDLATGGVAREARPEITGRLAHLEGRVARAVKLVAPDGREISLLGHPRFGTGLRMPDHTGVPAGQAGVLVVSTVADAVAMWLTEAGVPAAQWGDYDLRAEFFHPRTKASSSVRLPDTDYDHNGWFDGVSGQTDAAFASPSHLGFLYFGLDGAIPQAYTRTLDAIKKLTFALQNVSLMPESARREIARGGLTDMAGMLDELTRFMMKQPIDGKRLALTNFNALRKLVEVSYVVRYIDEAGQPQVLSADAVIARQQRGEGFGPEAHAEVVGLPIEHVLRLMGEMGLSEEYVNGAGITDYRPDLAQAQPYLRFPAGAWTDPRFFGGFTAVERDAEGTITGWATTDLLDFAPLQHLALPPARNQTFLGLAGGVAQEAMSGFPRERQTRAHEARAQRSPDGAFWTAQVKAVREFITKLPAMNPVARALHATNAQLNGELAEAAELRATAPPDASTPLGYGTAWVYSHRGAVKGGVSSGLLISTAELAEHGAPGDLVAVLAEDFDPTAVKDPQDTFRDEARDVLDELIGMSAVIELPPGNPSGAELRRAMKKYLVERGYSPRDDAPDQYVPRSTGARTQVERAYQTRLEEVVTRTARNRVPVFLSPHIGPHESTIYSVNGGVGAMERYFRREVVQTARFAGYIPAALRKQEIDTITTLQPLLESDEGRAYLHEMAGTGTDQTAVRDMDDALDELLDRLRQVRADETKSLFPNPQNWSSFGTGDLIPLVSYSMSGELVGLHLLRHGHEPVSEQDLRGPVSDANLALGANGVRLTIDRSTVDSDHTTYRGEIVEIDWDGPQGFTALVAVHPGELGTKVFETATQQKWTTAPPPSDLIVPTGAVFAGQPVRGVGDTATPGDRGSTQWWLNQPENIIEAVGFDVMPHLLRAFFPDSATHTADERDQVEQLLETFRNTAGGAVKAHHLVQRNTVSFESTLVAHMQQLLHEHFDGAAPDLDDARTERIADLTMLRLVLSALAAGAPRRTVLGAPGYVDRSSPSDRSHGMHRVFTTLLAQLPDDHPAKQAYVAQINARMARWTHAANGDGFYLNANGRSWTMRVTGPDGRVQHHPGVLAFPEVRNTDHFDRLSELAAARRGRASVSPTSLAMAHVTWGADAFLDETRFRAMDALRPNRLLHGTDQQAAQLTVNLGASATPFVTPADADLPMSQAEAEHLATRARPARAALAVEIDDSGWYTDMPKAKAAQAREEFQRTFNRVRGMAHLAPHEEIYLVEMIRAAVVRPALPSREKGEEYLTRKEALAALRLIEDNLKAGAWPLHRAPVNVISRDALTAMKRGGYRLLRGDGSNREVTSWEDWLSVMIGEAFTADSLSRRYMATTNIIDGLLEEYRKDIRGLASSPSVNPEVVALIRRVQTRNEVMVSSPERRRHMDFPGVQDGQPVYDAADFRTSDTALDELPQEARELVDQRMTEWESRSGLTRRQRQSPRAAARRAQMAKDDLAHTNKLLRLIELAYVGKTMLNPGLYVSAYLELGQRSGQERVVSFLSGSNLGAQGFTAEQRELWKQTRDALAQNGEFYRMIYENTNWNPSDGRVQGSLESRLQAGVTFASAMFNDPTWGARATTMAHAFMEAAWESIQRNGTYVSPEQFLDTLQANPSALAQIDADAVQRGYARVEYRRNLQDNLAERARRRWINGIVNSGRPGAAAFGVLLLRLPTMFFRFRSNTIINLMGLQGPHALLTTLLSDRTKRPGGLKDRLTGQDAEMDPAITDQARIEDSIDMTRAIIRSGVSHTQLFILGSVLGSLFGGDEDEEERFLTKLRRYQHVPVAKDPMSLENDFRNARAWFNDLLPGGLAVPSWIMRMFVSPAMGVARFQDTGDFRQVFWGFEDALGNMPLLNLDSVMNSWEIALELQAAAEAESLSESVDATMRATRLMVTAVGVLENMLLESAFLSMLYQAGDEWDRDPYAIVDRDELGNIRRDTVTGTPLRTTALQDIQDGDRFGQQGYARHTDQEALLRSLTENRPMLALVTALIQQDSTYLRTNMVPKTRTAKAEALDIDEAETLIMSILNNETGAEELTVDGAEAIVRGIHLGTVRADSPALQGVFIPRDMRREIEARVLEQMTDKYLDLGFSTAQALSKAKAEYYGQAFGEPEGLGFADILWNDDIIPAVQTQKYYQLNTTYVMGPGGRPIATGIERSIMSSAGMLPLETFHMGQSSNMPVDELLNSVDAVRGANLGMRGLVKVDETWVRPTPEEIGKGIEDALAEISKKVGGTHDPLGRRPFSYGSSYGRGSGYSGIGSIPRYGGMALRLDPQRRVRMPGSDDLYSINTANPIIRRATIRRERFSSERGRLNQWQ